MFPITQICQTSTGEAIDLEISLPEELATLAFAVNHGELSGRKDVTVRLTADIDLTGFRWVPIGFGDSEFAGVFDGCGHTVRGMTLQKDGPGNYGLFGAVSGTVQNLTVAGEIRNVTGDPHSAVGGIVGELSGGVVKNCAAEFTVDGGGEPLGLFAGGVAGAAEKGLMQNCRAAVRMENIRAGGLYLGGVAGCLRDSRAEDCAFALSLTALGGEGQTIHAGDVAGSIQGESALVNCVHWERMDSPVRDLEIGGNAYDDE